MATKPRVYMDACCFIDVAKQVASILPPDRTDHVWHIRKLLEAHKDGEIEVFTSVLSIAECTHADGRMGQDVRDLFARLLTSGQYLMPIQPTPFIAADARDLRWKHGITLRGADYIHVASALAVKCAEFITTDAKITGHASKIAALGLRVTEAHKTKLLPDKYRQIEMLSEKGSSVVRRLQRPQSQN